MKAAQLVDVADEDEAFAQRFDIREIDAHPATFWTRIWWGRADRVMGWVKELVPAGGVVADVGCASGSATILLAEAGFTCIGMDLRPSFLRYAKRKEDRTSVWWLRANALTMPLAEGSCDAVILGEILEHVAEPDVLMDLALRSVKVGGVLICTTPNGAGFRDRALPSYAEASKDLEDLKARQFGPAGNDHLFALRPEELLELAPEGASAKISFAGSGLWSRPLSLVARSRFLSSAVERVSRSGPWAPKVCTTVLIVLRRER